jgi:hypothetical protein
MQNAPFSRAPIAIISLPWCKLCWWTILAFSAAPQEVSQEHSSAWFVQVYLPYLESHSSAKKKQYSHRWYLSLLSLFM